MAIREVLTSFTFEQQRLMINLIGTDVGDASTLLTPTNVVVPAINEIVNGDVDLINQTHGMDPGSLASPSLYWDSGQGFFRVDANKIGLSTGLAIAGNLEVDGDITFRAGAGAGGTLTFGDLDTDNIIFNADVQSSIVPDTTANYNLGSLAKQWNNLWIDGTASIDTLTVDENSQFIGYIAVGSGDIRVPSTQTTVDLFDDYATTVEAFGDATDIRIGDTTGTLTLRNPTIVGSEATQNLFNTVATQVNAFGAATTINMGVSGGGGNSNLNILSDDTVCSGDLAINGGELLSSQTTFDLLINNDNINIGNTTGQGTTTINNRLQINGNLAIGGTSTYIELPDNQTNAFRFREGSNDYLQFRTEDGLERIVVWKDLYVVGNLDISGTTTTIDSTTLVVEDKNIELGNVTTPSDTTADGGGITLKATSDKTILYNNTTASWNTNIPVYIKPTSNVPQLKLEQNNAADVWKFHADGPNGGHLHIQREASAVDTTVLTVAATGNFGIGVPTSSAVQAPLEIYRDQASENSLFIHNPNASGYNGIRFGDSDRGTNGDHLIFSGNTLGIRCKNASAIVFETGSTPTERLRINNAGSIRFQGSLMERCHVVSGTMASNSNIYLENGNAFLFTTQETTTVNPNIRLSANDTLDGAMQNGEMVSITLMTTAASAAYTTLFNIDGNTNGQNGYTINVDWLGGSAPTAGGSAGIDVYSVTIIKQSSQNFNVLASVQNYA